MKRKIQILILPIILFSFIFSSCSKDEDENLSNYLQANSWELINECDDLGSLIFSEGFATVQYDGCPEDCFNLFQFDWGVDEKTGVLSISYRRFATICGEIDSGSGFPPETVTITNSTKYITVNNLTFEKQ